MPKNNYPTQRIESLPAEGVSSRMELMKTLRELSETDGRITGNKADDERFRQRVNTFFSICQTNGVRPGVEQLSCALGTTRMTLSRWKRGINCTETRMKDTQQALQVIYAFIENVGLNGDISPVVMIWLEKNWMGYTDRVELSTAQYEDDPARPRSAPEEIAERYRIYANAEPPELPNIDDFEQP